MTMLNTLFSIGSSLALLGWVLLFLVPRWRWTQAAVGAAMPALLALAYVALIGVGWADATRQGGGFASLAELRRLFADDALLLAGWLHYLAFDLLVGRQIVRSGQQDGWPHGALWPALLLCFLFGPAGWLLFQAMRLGRRAASARAWQRLPAWARCPEPWLCAGGVLFALALLPTALAHLLDGRTLGGVGVWVKPLKFELSLSVYLLTLALFYPLAGAGFRHGWAGRFVVFGPVAAALFEVGYIVLRAAQGQASHFNVGTPLSAAMYSLMGVGALVLTLAAGVLGWRILRTPVASLPSAGPSPLLRRAIGISLVLTCLLGTVSGALISGGASSIVGGSPLPGAALVPGLGWSREHGDLRVAHFLALHALQLLPMAAWAQQAAWPACRRGALGSAVFTVLALGYTAVTVVTFVQARAGLPLWPL